MRPLLTAALAALALSASAAPATYECDAVHSFALFRIKHLGVSQTWGRFRDVKGTIQYDEAAPAASSVSVEIAADSVDTGNEKRDQHLKSPDFLNAKQFPTIAFRSTAVKSVSADEASVTGDLTLHGVTKPVTARVVKTGAGKGMKGEALVGFEATFTIKRSDFGMDHMVGPIGDEVAITIALEGAKK